MKIRGHVKILAYQNDSDQLTGNGFIHHILSEHWCRGLQTTVRLTASLSGKHPGAAEGWGLLRQAFGGRLCSLVSSSLCNRDMKNLVI